MALTPGVRGSRHLEAHIQGDDLPSPAPGGPASFERVDSTQA